MDDLISILPAILSFISAGIAGWCAIISYATLRRKSRAQERFENNIANEIMVNFSEQDSEVESNKSFTELDVTDFSFKKEDIEKMLIIIDEINNGMEIKDANAVSLLNDKKILADLLAAYKSLDELDKNEISSVLKTGNILSINRFLTRSLYAAFDIIMSRFSKV